MTTTQQVSQLLRARELKNHRAEQRLTAAKSTHATASSKYEQSRAKLVEEKEVAAAKRAYWQKQFVEHRVPSVAIELNHVENRVRRQRCETQVEASSKVLQQAGAVLQNRQFEWTESVKRVEKLERAREISRDSEQRRALSAEDALVEESSGHSGATKP